MMENEILAKENRLFHAYLHRNLEGMTEEELDSYRQKFPDQGETIPLSLKFAMALKEQEVRTKNLKELKDKTAEDVCLLKAILESIKIRTDMLRKDTYRFQREVVARAEDPRTKQIKLDVVLRHWRSVIDEKRLQITKFTHKTNSLSAYRSKLKAQAHRRDETAAQHQITDFHQMQIKNQQLAQRIRELNTELFRVKALAGRATHQLSTARGALAAEVARQEQLEGSIGDKRHSASRLGEEVEEVRGECAKENARRARYRVQQSNPEMPHVLDYIGQKALVTDLEHQVSVWKRKVEIATVAATRAKGQIRRAQATQELPPINRK
jgi:hypothetical protein